MSKLITNTIRHTGGSADNITLDNSQNVTVEAKLTVANKDDDNVNVLEVKNDNGNVSGGFTQASDGDGQIFSKKNDGTNTVLFRSDGDSHITGGSLIIGDTNKDNALANADDLIIGDTGSDQRSGITIVSDTDKDCSIHFADGAGAGQYAGQINYDHNGDILRFYTGTTQRARIDSDGLKFSTDSSAANALDDYEEGTYNPTWAGITNYTSGYNTWHYTKIGRLVNIIGQLRCKTTQNDGTDVSFTLPFTPAAQTNAGNTGNFSIGPTMHYNVETGSGNLVTYAYGGNAYGYFYNNQEDSSWWILESQHVAFDESIYVNFTYIT